MVLKARVTHAEPKLEPRGNIVRVKVSVNITSVSSVIHVQVNSPVINLQSLRIGNLRSGHATAVQHIRRVITPRLGNGIRQPPTRVDSAKQDVHDRVTRFLTGDTSVEDGGDVGVVYPGLDNDRADSVHDNDGVAAYRGGVEDQVLAAAPESEVGPVALVTVHGNVACARTASSLSSA